MSDKTPSSFCVGTVYLWRAFWTLVSALLILWGLGLLLVQIVAWLKVGVWIELPATALWIQPIAGKLSPFTYVPHITDPAFTPDIFGPPGPDDWIGLRTIMLWLLDLPLMLYMVVFGVLSAIISWVVGRDIDVPSD